MAYKRRFSDDDVKRMEQDADAAGRITAAERQMALAGNSFNNRNNQIADLTAAAHERRLASRSHFVTMNPGAVSPQERASLAQERLTGRGRAIQDFERGMLQDKIKGEVGVAEAKRDGMIGQGRDAAEANGRFGLEAEKLRGASALTLEERKMAGQKDLAEIDAQSRQLGIEAEHGSYDKNGNYRPGSRVLSERERGEWSVKQQTEANKGLIAQTELKRQQQEAQERARKEKLTLEYAKLDEKTKKDIDAQATALSRDKQISFDEAKTQIMATREQSQQQDGEKKIKGYRYSTDRKQRIPVYEDGSEGAVEDVKA